MRPYLAIIKDSFRAALASKVLYVMLVLITFLLLVIAPLHYQETLDWKINRERNVTSPVLLFERLVDRHDDEGEEVVSRIWDRLSAPLQKDLDSFVTDYRAIESGNDSDAPEDDAEPDAEPEAATDAETDADDPDDEADGGNDRRQRRNRDEMFFREMRLAETLVAELNEMIQTDDFFDKAVWEGRALENEAQELLDEGADGLSEEHNRRLNRLLIGQAVSPTIQSGSATSLDFYYFTKRLEWISTNQTHSQFKNVFSSQISYIFDKFVMPIGLIIAILVTANVIPETFEPGSLNLLLSKPIFRWALLLAKFAGGCAFVALCAVYLFFGLWLWMGLGLGIWDRAILFSIPIYILVFAIYYSVSTFIGVWFRSAIVSVIMTALFWAVCFGVGSLYAWTNTYMHNSQLVHPVAFEDKAVAVDFAHQFVGWNQEEGKWKNQMPHSDNPEEQVAAGFLKFFGKLDQAPEPTLPPTIGPILNPSTQQILLGTISFGDPSSVGRAGFTIVDAKSMVARKVGSLPSGAVDLVLDDQGPIVIDSSGRFSRIDLEKAKAKPTDEKPKEVAAPQRPDRRNGRRGRQTNSISDWFTKIGPDKQKNVRGRGYACSSPSRNEIIIFQQLTVFVYQRGDEGKYELNRQVELDIDLPKSMSGQIECGGDTIMVTLGNGQVITLDADSLEEKKSYQPETRSAYSDVAASDDGRWFTITFRNGSMWMLDTQNDERMFRPRVTGQGGISGVTFEGQSVWVCDRTDRMTKYDTESLSREQQYTPPGGMMQAPFKFSYRYLIEPFYKVCPKPGEFYKLVTHLSSSADAKSNEQIDLRLKVEDRSPWSPLWSGLGFMCLMLFLSCLMFHYGDY